MATEAYKYRCHLCPKAFTRSSNLNYHVNAHKGIKPFSCSVCSECFTRAYDRDQHIKEKHTECPLYYCRQQDATGRVRGCGKGFKRERDLARHLSGRKGELCLDIKRDSPPALGSSFLPVAQAIGAIIAASNGDNDVEDVQCKALDIGGESLSCSSSALRSPHTTFQQLTVTNAVRSYQPSTHGVYKWNLVATIASNDLVSSLRATYPTEISLSSTYPLALQAATLRLRQDLLVCAQVSMKQLDLVPLYLCVNAIYTLAVFEGDSKQVWTHIKFIAFLVNALAWAPEGQQLMSPLSQICRNHSKINRRHCSLNSTEQYKDDGSWGLPLFIRYSTLQRLLTLNMAYERSFMRDSPACSTGALRCQSVMFQSL